MEGLAGDGDDNQATYRSWMPTPLQTPATPPQAAPPASAPADTGRVLQAEITEHPLDRPLDETSEFTLAFFVEEAARANLQAAGRFEEGGLFQDSAQLETLHVVVTSQDFTIHTRTPQSLHVPSQGRSRNKARFDLEPKHRGPGEVTAVFYKENNFIQGLSVTLNVAEGARAIEKVLPLGRPLEASGLLLARDVMLLFKKVVDGFDVVAVGEVSGMAHLPVKEHYLHSLIAQARQALLKVVYLGKDAQNQMVEMDAYGNLPGAVEFVFQTGLDIPEPFSTRALHILAEAGVALFKGLFFGDGFPQEARQLGDRLRELSEKQPLRLQIVSQEFLLPWGLLYPARRFDPTTIQPEGFLGFKHRIEHIPLMSGMQALDRRIRSNQPRLAVSLNFDPQIDAQFGLPLLQPQRERWAQYQSDGRVELIERSSAAAFIDALINPTTPDQILYFFGHAETRGLDEPGGPGESSLLFGEGDLLTLTRLKNETFDDVRLPGAPLVFINACESAELSPLFYGGFMPFFTTRGARGLIGTECRVPAALCSRLGAAFLRALPPGRRNPRSSLPQAAPRVLHPLQQPARPALCPVLRRRHAGRALALMPSLLASNLTRTLVLLYNSPGMPGTNPPLLEPPIRLIWRRFGALLDRLLRLAGLRRTRLRRFALEQPLSEALLALAQQQQRPPEEIAAELLSSGLAQHDRQSEAWQRWEALSSREQQVAALVCQGYTSRQIAARLMIAEETARTHVRNILRRYNLHSRSELRKLFEDWDFNDLI